MAVPAFQLRCTANNCIANGIFEFTFDKPQDFSHKAGQFILFDVPLLSNPLDIQTRALSIASAPHEPVLRFVNKQKEGGRGSQWIEKVLRAGTEVRIQGPFGNFQVDRETEYEYVFIATSTGVAPFRAHILDAIARKDTRRMDVIFGVRSEEDLFWKQEWEALAHDHPNVFVHIALSQPLEAWKGHKGRVQIAAPQVIHDFSRKSVYVCGSPDMTKEVKQLCLEQWGVEKKDLHVEGYI